MVVLGQAEGLEQVAVLVGVLVAVLVEAEGSVVVEVVVLEVGPVMVEDLELGWV